MLLVQKSTKSGPRCCRPVWRQSRVTEGPPKGPGNDNGKHRSPASAESVAFLVLGGVAVGAGAGAGIDWLVRTFPLFTVIGVFAGFVLALYAVYLETK